jgi:hypothetical protein
MDSQRRKQILQVVILVVLLGGLGASVFLVLIPSLNPPRPTQPQQAQAGQQPAQQQTGQQQPRSTAVDMPPVAGVTPRQGSQEDALGPATIAGIPTQMNPNLFQQFEIQTPRNPFVKREEWYSGLLAEHVPGYPELRESGYWDEWDPYLPDIDFIFDGEKEWSEVSVNRTQNNSYEFSGISEDGNIRTAISLIEDKPTTATLEWMSGTNTPVSALKNPGYAKEYANQQQPGRTTAPPDDSDLFRQPDASGGEGLPFFDQYTNGQAPAQGPGGVVLGSGDQLVCRGVSAGAGKSTALIDFNGMPFIVSEGDVLPTRYEITKISGDGVAIKELRDGSTIWLPLTLLLENGGEGGGGNNS